MSVAEMKPSQVLREALKLMAGGNKWIKGTYFRGNSCCSLGAIRSVLNVYWDDNEARWLLAKAVVEGDGTVSEWNDNASDFSVIEQGFQKAIALAESEGK